MKTDELKARLEKSKSEMRIGPGEQIDELSKKQEEARRKVQQIRPSGDEAWEDLQTGAEQAMTNLKEAIGLAVSRFKNEK